MQGIPEFVFFRSVADGFETQGRKRFVHAVGCAGIEQIAVSVGALIPFRRAVIVVDGKIGAAAHVFLIEVGCPIEVARDVIFAHHPA